MSAALLTALSLALLMTGAEAHNKSGTDSEVLIIFLFVGTLLGAMTTHLLSRYAPGLPYTVSTCDILQC